MSHVMRRVPALLLAAGLVVVWGCGESKPAADSTTEEATVTGTVTVKGQPARGGTVTFDPTNINRPDAPVRSAEIQPDGTYSATTLVGSNTVMVNVAGPQGQGPGMNPEGGLNVQSGTNTYDITLPVEGADQ